MSESEQPSGKKPAKERDEASRPTDREQLRAEQKRQRDEADEQRRQAEVAYRERRGRQ